MPRSIELSELERRKMAEAGRQSIACTNGWRPIETAPKDGTSILIYGVWQGEISKNPQYWDIFKAVHSFGEWLVCDCDIYGATVLKPTHWQPLPKTPQEAA